MATSSNPKDPKFLFNDDPAQREEEYQRGLAQTQSDKMQKLAEQQPTGEDEDQQEGLPNEEEEMEQRTPERTPTVKVSGPSVIIQEQAAKLSASTSGGEDKSYSWNSGNPTVAVVKGMGKSAAVVGVRAGVAAITATGSNTGAAGSKSVRVIKRDEKDDDDKNDDENKKQDDLNRRLKEAERERKLNEDFAKKRIQERELGRTGREGLGESGKAAEAGEKAGEGIMKAAKGLGRVGGAAEGGAAAGGAAATTAGTAAAGTAAGGAAAGAATAGGTILLIIGAILIFIVIFIALMVYLCNYEGASGWFVRGASKVYGWLGGSDVCAPFTFKGGGTGTGAGGTQSCDAATLQQLAQQYYPQSPALYPAGVSPELTALMNCIAITVPQAPSLVSGITDSYISCNYSRGHTQQCASSCHHSSDSCHYGGHSGTTGARAVDYAVVGAVGNQIVAAAQTCGGAKRRTCEDANANAVACTNASATHVHISTITCDADAFTP
jgi:hypothetical protein